DGLAGDDHHRHGVHQGRQKARDGVGGPRPGGHEAHARLAGRPGQTVGHVRGALLVAGQDEFDVGIDQRVENRNRGTTRVPEDVLDALLLHAVNQGLGAGADFFGHSLPLFSRFRKTFKRIRQYFREFNPKTRRDPRQIANIKPKIPPTKKNRRKIMVFTKITATDYLPPTIKSRKYSQLRGFFAKNRIKNEKLSLKLPPMVD